MGKEKKQKKKVRSLVKKTNIRELLKQNGAMFFVCIKALSILPLSDFQSQLNQLMWVIYVTHLRLAIRTQNLSNAEFNGQRRIQSANKAISEWRQQNIALPCFTEEERQLFEQGLTKSLQYCAEQAQLNENGMLEIHQTVLQEMTKIFNIFAKFKETLNAILSGKDVLEFINLESKFFPNTHDPIVDCLRMILLKEIHYTSLRYFIDNEKVIEAQKILEQLKKGIGFDNWQFLDVPSPASKCEELFRLAEQFEGKNEKIRDICLQAARLFLPQNEAMQKKYEMSQQFGMPQNPKTTINPLLLFSHLDRLASDKNNGDEQNSLMSEYQTLVN